MQKIEKTMSQPSIHPQSHSKSVTACLDACVACEIACVTCVDACLSDAQVTQLTKCIRLDLDCADVCSATARVLARQGQANSEIQRLQLQACERACAACAQECEKHAAMHEHCRTCAEACRKCEEACRTELKSLQPSA